MKESDSESIKIEVLRNTGNCVLSLLNLRIICFQARFREIAVRGMSRSTVQLLSITSG